MNFDKFILEVESTVSGSSDAIALFEDAYFWKMDDQSILDIACYLSEGGRYEDILIFMSLAKNKRYFNGKEPPLNLYHIYGDALIALEKINEALQVYNKIIDIKPDDVAYTNLGLIFWENNSYLKAFENYVKAISINPLNVIAMRGAGEMLNELNRPNDAIPYLTKAVDLLPTYSAAYTALGVAYFNSGDWQKSYRALKKAVSLNPNDRVAIKGLIKLESN